MTRRAMTFVSVVFEAELALLELQAMSMDQFLHPAEVVEIIVIDNTRRGLGQSAVDGLLAHYGQLSSRVRLVRPREITDVPRAIGWRTQQILKLSIAASVTSDRYVVLDAKNHFVAKLSPDSFEAADGRPRVPAYGYAGHPLRADLVRVLTYLGLDSEGYLQRFPATTTPFVLDTESVVQMINDVQRASGRTFADEFVRQRLTEFFLYSGWIAKTHGSIEAVMSMEGVACPIVWPHAANRAGVEEAVDLARLRRTPIFSVHRTALATLDVNGVAALATYWVQVGLFPSVQRAEEFVQRFRRGYLRRRRRRQVLESPQRVIDLATRLRSQRRLRHSHPDD